MTKLVLGIVICGEVPESLRDDYLSYHEMFENLFNQVDKRIQYRCYNALNGQYPLELDECDGYLFTGSKSGVYDDEPWIARLMDFIKLLVSQEKKICGICFGHQIIAEALSGHVEKSDKGWGVGVMTYRRKCKPGWMQPDLEQVSLLVSHQDQVMRLPYAAELILENEFCPNAAFHVPGRVLCFQGHPEFTPDFSQRLMNARAADIQPEALQRGLDSVYESTDHLQVAHWILNFFKAECA